MADSNLKTFEIKISGLVQGVGFRPFIYRIAKESGLKGSVENRTDGVQIVINASTPQLKSFVKEIECQLPGAASMESIAVKEIGMQLMTDFSILPSQDLSNIITEISPDIAVCPSCLKDLDEQAHRIDYPFINCTHCGPRFTIIRDLPYDRAHTTMSVFRMCETCQQEYTDVSNRRFHAQPVACSHCGPSYSLLHKNKEVVEIKLILTSVSELVENGKTIAMKGMGGFHLMCDAFNGKAVENLRIIKLRESKPFAVMCKNLETAREIALISDEEAALLTSWRRPVVLLKSKDKVAGGVSNGLDKIGIMLPYLPLHYMMFRYLKTSCVVLTSGNISDEPIMIDNDAAFNLFIKLTDAVLLNNREIYNRCDDSVVSVVNGKPLMVRRSRGYVPSPVRTHLSCEGIFGAGAELVNCFGMGKGNQILLSQHIGDLKNAETYDFYRETFERFSRLFRFKPEVIAADLHPHYLSGAFARELATLKGLPLVEVQHHHAHIGACMAEHKLDEDVIGISMDGVGLGTDGHIWGGEFMVANLQAFQRKFHLEYIPIAGGDKVAYEPWRSAMAYLYFYFGKEALQEHNTLFPEVKARDMLLYENMLEKKINTFLYSSSGRLFDAVAALSGLCCYAGFHAEAPMRLEFALKVSTEKRYDYELINDQLTFKETFRQIVKDRHEKVHSSMIAAKFHNTIVQMILEMTQKMSLETGIQKVVVSGGTFQNTYLLKRLSKEIAHTKLSLFFPSQIPPNDGGIAAGQIIIAAKQRS